MPRPVLIDTDTGVDDALALILAFRSPEIRVVSVTTVAGNVDVYRCTRNANVVVDHLGVEPRPRIVMGSSRPLRRPLIIAPEVHGYDGLGNTLSSPPRLRPRSGRGVTEIIEFCRTFGSEGTIVAIGPLTNLARAFLRDGRTVSRIGRIISMGGAFRVAGNTGPVAEFNYYVDPHAAHLLMQSGLPLTVLPLDVTERVIITRSQFLRAGRNGSRRRQRFLSAITRDYMRYHLTTEGFLGGYLHDPLAVAVAVDPGLVVTKRYHVQVETASPLTRGMTVANFRSGAIEQNPLVHVVTDADVPRVLRLFNQRIWE